MAAISEDRPLGIVLEANRKALKEGIMPGMRYAAALSLVPGLRAVAFSDTEIEETVLALSRILADFSPSVEPAVLDPAVTMGVGTFWLAAGGLRRIFGTPEEWAAAICRALSGRPSTDGMPFEADPAADEMAPAAPAAGPEGAALPAPPGFTATVAVGATRFGTYAASRLYRRNTVFRNIRQEREILRRAPLRILPFDPRTAETLFRLGVHTVHDFTALPAGGVRKRFGEGAAAVHRFAQGLGTLPVQGLHREDPLIRTRRFASPITNRTFVVVAAVQLLDELHTEAVRRRWLIREMELTLVLESGWQEERPQPLSALLRPAVPTGNRALLEKLLRLRVDGLTIAEPVEELSLSVTLRHARHAQAEFFSRPPERDPAAADRAFALVRAELGNNSVCVARLLPENLPRERFRWVPLEHLPAKAGKRRSLAPRPLLRVRRLFGVPETAGPSRPGRLGRSSPESEALHFSGTWWDNPYQVEYRYFTADDGTLLWLERRDSRWIIQGAVE